MNGLKILVSGGTGFLGREVVPLLRARQQVTLLSRKPQVGPSLVADLTKWNAGLDEETISGQFDVFMHLSGLYDLRANDVELMKQNVFATQTAMTLAQAAKIPFFVNASTIAVTINQKILEVDPYELDLKNEFPDAYSRTKALAEDLVRNWKSPIKRLNLRLGSLVGSTKGDSILRIDGPYHAPEALKKMRSLINFMPVPILLPGNTKSLLPILPVDTCAQAIVSLLDYEWQNLQVDGFKSYHVLPEQLPTISELYESCFKYQDIRNSFHLSQAIPDSIAMKAAHWLAKFPKEEMTYLLKMPKLNSRSTRQILGENWCPRFSEYKSAFWKGYNKYVSNR
jgi:UDP-glucose 4-epimerase